MESVNQVKKLIVFICLFFSCTSIFSALQVDPGRVEKKKCAIALSAQKNRACQIGLGVSAVGVLSYMLWTWYFPKSMEQSDKDRLKSLEDSITLLNKTGSQPAQEKAKELWSAWCTRHLESLWVMLGQGTKMAIVGMPISLAHKKIAAIFEYPDTLESFVEEKTFFKEKILFSNDSNASLVALWKIANKLNVECPDKYAALNARAQFAQKNDISLMALWKDAAKKLTVQSAHNYSMQEKQDAKNLLLSNHERLVQQAELVIACMDYYSEQVQQKSIVELVAIKNQFIEVINTFAHMMYACVYDQDAAKEYEYCFDTFKAKFKRLVRQFDVVLDDIENQ